jgi:formylglycine-generating enzyme required for sulfatase activity
LLIAGAIVAQQWFLREAQDHARVLSETNATLEQQRGLLLTQKGRIEELADTRDLRRLNEAASRGWRAIPAELDGVGGLRAWLADAGRLLERRAGHVRTLQELLWANAREGGGEAPPSQPGEFLATGAALRERASTLAREALACNVIDSVRAWRTEAIAAHLVDLEKLESTVLPRVQGVESFATRVEEESLRKVAELWQAAAERLSAQPRYQGMQGLRPQLGLVPLGPDPRSGLEEFALLQTGAVPRRAASTGQLELDADSALVLVLLGHSTFVMGAERMERSGHCEGANIDPAAEPREAPAHSVTLKPYFIAKHEMTQAQWERVSGSNPSFYRAGMAVRTGVSPTPLHPVESVTALEAEHVLALLGLALPSEAQWENAARGRSDSRDAGPWWCGARESLASAANLADLTLAENGGPAEAQYEDWYDGYVVHAPILGRVPNGFGLHDMLGNVAELCADAVADYSIAASPVTGLRIPSSADVAAGRANPENRVFRGGGFLSNALRARTTRRDFQSAHKREHFCGLRPVRAVD